MLSAQVTTKCKPNKSTADKEYDIGKGNGTVLGTNFISLHPQNINLFALPIRLIVYVRLTKDH